MSDNELLSEILSAIAEQVYEYLKHKLPEKLLEEMTVNVSLVDLTNYVVEISVDASASPLFSGLEEIINSAVEFGFKIADYIMEKFKKGELNGLQLGEIERITEEYARSLRNNA